MSWNFGMDFGNLLSGGLGIIASNSSARKQFKYQSALQRQAFDLTQRGYREGPSNQRQGLENAGYNPMLAVQNGVAGSNATFSAGQAQSIDYGSKFANAVEIQNAKNNSALTESQVNLQHAQAQESRQRTINEHLREGFITPRERAELQKTNSEINNLQADSSLKEATIQNLKDRLELDRMLGFAGLDVQMRGQDKMYNASTYATDSKFASDIYGLNLTHPFAKDYVGTLYNDSDVSRALYNSIKKNSYRNPKYR